jgi:purine-binding chemotaxis protein CheW
MVSSAESELRPSLLFRIAGQLCALPLEHVIETMRPLPVEPVAGAPPAVRGLSIVRGRPVPVIDAARLFDRPSGLSTRFVTLRAGERVAALAVDEVLGVRRLAPASLEQLPALLGTAAADALSAIGTLDAELLLILDGGRMIPEEFAALVGAPGAS